MKLVIVRSIAIWLAFQVARFWWTLANERLGDAGRAGFREAFLGGLTNSQPPQLYDRFAQHAEFMAHSSGEFFGILATVVACSVSVMVVGLMLAVAFGVNSTGKR